MFTFVMGSENSKSKIAPILKLRETVFERNIKILSDIKHETQHGMPLGL